MLDFAILIALYYCELNFMCRIIPEARKAGAKENHLRPFGHEQEKALKEDKWTQLGLDPLFAKVISRLDNLKDM